MGAASSSAVISTAKNDPSTRRRSSSSRCSREKSTPGWKALRGWVRLGGATQWVARLSEAKRQGALEAELRRLSFIPLIVVDEVGYIPFDPEAANLMFSLVSSRYERASLIVTSNKPFSGWGDIFGDEVTAAAMIDRLVHHAEILALKGDSYRLKDRDLARAPVEN